jgi:hypothetical protein
MEQQPYFAVNNAWQVEPSERHLRRVAVRLVRLPLRFLSPTAGQAGAVALGFAALLAALTWSHRRHPALRTGLVFALPLLLAVTLVDLVRHSSQLEYVRYTYVAGPLVFVLLAMAVEGGRRIAHLLPAAALVMAVTTSLGTRGDARIWHDVAARLQQVPAARIVYVAGNAGPLWPHTNWLCVAHHAPELAVPIVLHVDPARPVPSELLPPGRPTWIVCGQADLPVESIVPGGRPVPERDFTLPGVGRATLVVP